MPATVPGAAKLAALKKPEAYVIDTAAVLTNRRLDQLLTEAHQTDLIGYQSATALPPVIAAFLKRMQRGPVAIADVGQAYKATDVHYGDLPSRQLTYLGIGGNVVLLADNWGGFGVSERVLLFHLKDGEIADFWTGCVKGNRHTKQSSVTCASTKTRSGISTQT